MHVQLFVGPLRHRRRHRRAHGHRLHDGRSGHGERHSDRFGRSAERQVPLQGHGGPGRGIHRQQRRKRRPLLHGGVHRTGQDQREGFGIEAAGDRRNGYAGQRCQQRLSDRIPPADRALPQPRDDRRRARSHRRAVGGDDPQGGRKQQRQLLRRHALRPAARLRDERTGDPRRHRRVPRSPATDRPDDPNPRERRSQDAHRSGTALHRHRAEGCRRQRGVAPVGRRDRRQQIRARRLLGFVVRPLHGRSALSGGDLREIPRQRLRNLRRVVRQQPRQLACGRRQQEDELDSGQRPEPLRQRRGPRLRRAGHPVQFPHRLRDRHDRRRQPPRGRAGREGGGPPDPIAPREGGRRTPRAGGRGPFRFRTPR